MYVKIEHNVKFFKFSSNMFIHLCNAVVIFIDLSYNVLYLYPWMITWLFCRPLPEIGRVPGLELTGDEFANLLMVFEFIHNFGETLNFGKLNLFTFVSSEATRWFRVSVIQLGLRKNFIFAAAIKNRQKIIFTKNL